MPQKKVPHNHQLNRSCSSKQYPNHIPTSLLQKMVLTAGSAAAALSDPWRADMVAVNGEVTGLPALKYMHGQKVAGFIDCLTFLFRDKNVLAHGTNEV